MSNIPESDIDFYSDEVILNPHPVYAALREMGPVVYLRRNNVYAVSRYAEVSEVLRQPLRFVSSRGVSPIQKVNDIVVGSTLNSDPPEHDLTRAVTSEPLLPGALVEVEARLKDAAEGLIDTLCARGEFDAVTDLANYLPLTIVTELVGLPDDAGVPNMLKWASATFNLFGTENSRTDQAFEDLQGLRDFLLEYGQPAKLKPGGWAKRIFEVGPQRGISQEKCAQLMRDYIAPSLDTTISTTAQIIKLLSDHPDQWQLLRTKPELIPNAVEEAVRLATPIRAFTRYVIEDTAIAGHHIPAGARVLVIYASANRDERKFTNPDRFDVTRDVHDHVGFGQGVHMCMGMHLARREMIQLLHALRRRVERIEVIGEPVVAMNNVIRGYSSLPVRVHMAKDQLQECLPTTATGQSTWMNVVIAKRETVATDIIALHLQSADGTPLPQFEAGAHVDVRIHSGLTRQYSLCTDPADKTSYRLAVLREPGSRGGSAAVHDQFQPGLQIRIGRPRNNFPLRDGAEHTILMAGGVGITPILSMAYALEARKASWELNYAVRSEDRLAFRQELAEFGNKVSTYLDNASQSEHRDIRNALGKPAQNRHLYVCGPNGFMDFIVQSARDAGWNDNCIHIERFGAEVDTDGVPFTLIAARSGKSTVVNPGESIAAKLRELDIEVPVSCQSGVCGTCLTPVLEGTPDHRDLVLTESEKAANDRITVCCSRSKTKTLVLDV